MIALTYVKLWHSLLVWAQLVMQAKTPSNQDLACCVNQDSHVRSFVPVTFRLKLVYFLSSKTVPNSLSGTSKKPPLLISQHIHLL